MDSESLQTLREVACSEANLPSSFAHRVQGTDIGTMRRDARQLAQDLGFAPPPQPPARTPDGRFASTSGHQNQRANNWIRSALGYSTSEQSEPPVVGDIGVGRGGGALPRESRQPVSMNDLIRGTANAPRDAAHMFAEQLASERVRGA
jgi:hypothetical protein